MVVLQPPCWCYWVGSWSKKIDRSNSFSSCFISILLLIDSAYFEKKLKMPFLLGRGTEGGSQPKCHFLKFTEIWISSKIRFFRLIPHFNFFCPIELGQNKKKMFFCDIQIMFHQVFIYFKVFRSLCWCYQVG